MIPLAIKLKGFLSFRDEATLRFEQDCVQLLSGPNGTGKSSVFDAIVFALFGVHRGGTLGAGHLINKQSDVAYVAFDFEMNGKTYRAERGLKRKTGTEKIEPTRQLYVQQSSEWKPIAGTHQDKGFAAQMEDKILGLSADAFMSSVLLMQGRAEDLIQQDNDTAKQRFGTLKKLVGLEHYDVFLMRADASHRDHKAQVERLQGKLDTIRIVTDEELADLDGFIQKKEAEVATAREDVKALENRKERAALWTRLQADITETEARQRQDAALLKDAAQIKIDSDRLNDLDRILPHLKRLVEMRKRQSESSEKLKLYEAERDALMPKLDRIAQERQKLQQRRTDGQQKQDERDAKQSELSKSERQQSAALPWLRKLHDARRDLKTVTGNESQYAADAAKAEAECKQLEKEKAKLADDIAAIDEKLNEAKHATSTAQAQLDAIVERQKRFGSVSGKKTCNYCGQPMTAEHVKKEKKEIEKQLADMQKELDEAILARDKLDGNRGKLVKKNEEVDGKRQEARRLVDRLAERQQRTQSDIERLVLAIRSAYDELAPSIQTQICSKPPKDWLTTTYPTDDDLTKCKANLEDLGRQIEALTTASAAWKKELAGFTSQETHLDKEAKGLDAQKAAVTASIVAEQRALDTAKLDEVTAAAALPDHWRKQADALTGKQLSDLQKEQQNLITNGTNERFQHLQQAASRGDDLRERLTALQAQQADYPDNTRCSPDTVEVELRKSRDYERARDRELNDMTGERKRLSDSREQRAKIEQEYLVADRKRQLSKRLVDLLGPKQLQRYLLRQAEVGIVENANRVLNRLSAGQIELQLLPDDENEKSRALQLIAHKPDDGNTYLLTYLSGSEKFRIAVSLALGIGQYASRLQKPIESVIIDEGFGCLDRENRDAIISEIDQLRGQLRCIVLVSHQEEFAQEFPRGYRFRKENGTTRVDPLAA